MLRNLLLALFLIALALPAVAVPVAPAQASEPATQDCHGMPVEQKKDETQHHDGGARLHGCIGCIAPQEPEVALPPVMVLPFVVQDMSEPTLSGTAQRPTIPPPRA